MDSITADLEKVDMGPAVVLFDDKVVEEQRRFCSLGRMAGWASGRIGLRQDGPLEVRFPRDTWSASRDFCRRAPEEDDALLVSGHTRIKPRLRLHELVKEVMVQQHQQGEGDHRMLATRNGTQWSRLKEPRQVQQRAEAERAAAS